MKQTEVEFKKIEESLNKRRLSEKDFELLYKAYHKKVYDFTFKRVSNAHVAEDLTSAIFEKILKSMSDFQWHGVTISAWIFRIARNEVIDYYRKNSKYKGNVSLNEIANIIVSKDPEAMDSMLDAEIQANLYNSIREFREDDQYLIYYKFFEGLDNKTIAKLRNMSETNIGTRLHRIRKKLKELMKNAEA